MISQAKKLVTAGIVSLIVFLVSLPGICGETLTGEMVSRVIDGDTFEISGGRRIRLLGIDAPERGAPLSTLAAERLEEITGSEMMDLEVCDSRDIYGRMLAVAIVGEINANETLLKEGLALPMLIPPCGNAVWEQVLRAAGIGALSGKGIYSLDKYRIISDELAEDHIGQHLVIRGRILEFYIGERAWHLNFGSNWKTDFTAVVFRNGQNRFQELGIDPAALVGTEVLVIGDVQRYNGPQIIIRGPEQILPIQ